MTIKRIVAAYFSPTGTTAKVVQALAGDIAKSLCAPLTLLDFTLPPAREASFCFTRQDLVVLGTPVYAGRVPNVLLPFFKNKWVGGGATGVPVVLFGNRNYDDALVELRDLMEQCGMHTVAAGAFVGEHAFSKILAAGRPDEADLAKVHLLADIVVKRLSAPSAGPAPVKGHSPYRPYYTPKDRAGNPVNILKVKPKVKSHCTNCGLCARVCPMGSINPQNVREYLGICIKCGACLKKCPENARYYDDPGYLYHQRELEEGLTRRAKAELF